MLCRLLTLATVVACLAPPWIVVMWMQFATLFRFSLSFLSGRYLLSIVLGALGGPFAFWIGERLGAVTFVAPEWRSMLVAGLANSVGLVLIVVVQYVTFAATGTVYWTDGWLYVNLLFGVVPMMFVLPYFNRYFFRMTGRIYLGPMVTCLVFIMILITNTVIYIPL